MDLQINQTAAIPWDGRRLVWCDMDYSSLSSIVPSSTPL
jgi:hypothetical protein